MRRCRIPNLKTILLLLFWMAVGGAVGKWVAVPASEGRSTPVMAVFAGTMAALAVAAWALTLSHLLRHVHRDNPSQVVAEGLGAASLSLMAVSFLLLSSNPRAFWMLLGAGCAVGFAGAPFKLRAITVKYANKRKAAQSA